VNDAQPVDTDGSRPELVMAFSNLGHTCTHMFTILFATAVLHLPGVFGIPYGELLGLSSFGLVLFGVAALPAGWLGDRWSQVGMMVVFFLGIGAGSVITGLATGTGGLFAGLTCIGLFASIYHPVGIAWLVAGAKRHGMTLGINGLFGSAGSALGPVFVGAMIDLGSWRAAFIIPGAVAMAAGIALAAAWSKGWVQDSSADRTPHAPPEPGAMRRVFLILTLTMACSGIVYTGVTNTMPKLFETGLGGNFASSYTEIGFYVGAVIGLSSFSSILGGWLADRYSARSIYIVFWLLLSVPVFLMVTSSGVTLLAVALLAMVFNTAFSAAENLLVARYTPFEWRALAYGAKFVLALGIGGITVHVAGAVYDKLGSFEMLYVAFAGFSILAAVSALGLPKPGRRRLADATV
jgi:MFS family permease